MTQDRPPVPGVGCGAAIFNESGQILLIQRLTEPEAGAWGLPGGKIDFGERVKDAIKREIKEELGIIINIVGSPYITEIIDKGDAQHWVSPVYEARISSGTPELLEPHKHGGWAWYDLNDLPNALTTPTVQVLQNMSKIKARI